MVILMDIKNKTRPMLNYVLQQQLWLFFSYLSYLAQSSKFDVETSSITVIIW